MRVGFTGTRRGMTEDQEAAVFAHLTRLRAAGAEYMAHGCCEGADRQAHDIWRGLGGSIEFCPGDEDQEAWIDEVIQIEDIRPIRIAPGPAYLERNHQIATTTSVLVAAPRELQETRRGGTWATVRYARRAGSTVLLCLSDGSVRREDSDQAQLQLGSA